MGSGPEEGALATPDDATLRIPTTQLIDLGSRVEWGLLGRCELSEARCPGELGREIRNPSGSCLRSAVSATGDAVTSGC